MKIIEYFNNNKRNVAIFILIITVILTLFIATSRSKYVLEKELKFNLQIVESEEWNKRTLITGEELNDIFMSTEATQIVFGYEDDYTEEIKDIEGIAVGVADTAKSFKDDDIKLYTITDSQDITTALILSKYEIKANKNSSKMFYNYETLTNVIFSNFETTNVENMDSMFYGCNSLTKLDLYKFNTAQVTNISSMFRDCNFLETIYASELWDLIKIETIQENVFLNCENLIGGNETAYDETKISSDYACIDTNEEVGYFTYKSIDTQEEPVTFNLVRPNITENTITTNTITSNENEINITKDEEEKETEIVSETDEEIEINENIENIIDTNTDTNNFQYNED